MRKVTLTEIDLDELLQSFRSIVKEEIQAEQLKDLQEKLLSPKNTCNLFDPKISLVTLESWAEKGYVNKHYLGGRTWYKYSEIIESIKTLKRYKKPELSTK